MDTLRADHVGCERRGRTLTPAMDTLGAQGTSFTATTAPAPWTLPSFTSALTGLMPCLHGAGMTGATRNMAHDIPTRLGAAVPNLARHLQTCGYRTAAFYANPFVEFGLAESFQQHHYRNHASADVAHLALDWMRRHGDRPFFCFVLFNDPHEPTLPPASLYEPLLDADPTTHRWTDAELRSLARWGGVGDVPHLGRVDLPLGRRTEDALAAKKTLYAAAVAGVDQSVGLILDQLDGWGLESNTLVTLLSDHGEEFLEHAAAARDWDHDPRDLRAIGHGQSLFQELLHVPWLLRGPGVPAGQELRRPVSLLDVAPTLAETLGVKPFPLRETPMPELRGLVQALETRDTAADRVLLAENIAYGPDLVMARRGDWKLVTHRDGRDLALYRMSDDPGETCDRRADAPAELAILAAIVKAWREAVAADGSGGDSWESADEKIRRQLRELGYAD